MVEGRTHYFCSEHCGQTFLGHGGVQGPDDDYRHGDARLHETDETPDTIAIDPVRGMSLDPNTALSAIVDGTTYYFCSAHCQHAYARDGGSSHEHGHHPRVAD